MGLEDRILATKTGLGMDGEGKLVDVYIYRDDATGPVLKGVLEQAGINVRLRAFQHAAYETPFTPIFGLGAIQVQERNKKKAQEILEEHLKKKG